MANLSDNKNVACYYTTKHSWRGRYKRLFAVGTRGITTYNPSSLQVTNQWSYSEFCGIILDHKSKNNNDFLILLRKSGKKNESMKFSCDYREHLMTVTKRFCPATYDSGQKPLKYTAMKYQWSSRNVPVILEVAGASLNQLDRNSLKVLTFYDYIDIEGFALISDAPNAFVVIHKFQRLHMFACDGVKDIIKASIDAAQLLGRSLKLRKDPISLFQFENYKFGKYSDDEHITSIAEFTVLKQSPRHQVPPQRLLCLSETCILERDPGSYSIITLKPLIEIYALVRDPQNPQIFTMEFKSGQSRTYVSTDRDALLATIMDGSRSSGNRDICVKMLPTDTGLHFGPLANYVEEEVESLHMKYLTQPPVANFMDIINRFNSSIPYSGLQWSVKQDGFFTENKEKMIISSLGSVLDKDGNSQDSSDEDIEAQFHLLRRLVASKVGFAAFTALPRFREHLGVKVIKALQLGNDGVSHAAIDTLVSLLCPMHDNYDLRQEQLNKASLLSSKQFLQSLLDHFEKKSTKGQGALVISSLLDFFNFALCAPHSETTEGKCFDELLQLVAEKGKCLFRLFQHPSTAIVKGAGMVMKAIIEEADSETAAYMQQLALSEGAMPHHLHTALFTKSVDLRMATNQQLSRHLIGLWTASNPPAMELLKRAFPAGLLTFLDSEDDVPDEGDLLHVRDNLKSAINQSQSNSRLKQLDKQLKQVERIVTKKAQILLTHWRDTMGVKAQEENQQKPIVLRKRRQRIKIEANWPLFYHSFSKDHAKSNLIWNHKTREELRSSLESEIRGFHMDVELAQHMNMSWNHSEFEVPYDCLSDEIKIGDYYLRLLLEEEFEPSLAIRRPYELFNDLYHRFLLSPKTSMKCMCLQAMAIVYGRYWEDIGPFNDTKYVVGMLERCLDRTERDRLILFFEKIIKHKRNMKDIIDANGIKAFVELLSLAHLHTTRAHVPTQRNVIEASAEMLSREGEKEWYFGNKEKERLGPYSFQEMKDFWQDGILNAKSRCWAQGMDGWRPLHSVTQLKWSLMASGSAILNETEMATTILNILILLCQNYPSRDSFDAVVRPMPKVKRILSEAVCLPHCIQILLTFDPVLVEKTSVLLLHSMDNNPVFTKIYLTGVFFFVLMYTGSNILPIAKFLKYLHMKQAFRSEENKSHMLSASILGALFPEAMIHYLENHGPERFSEIFLGEFDTPEAIWNGEMRRYMIEKIAVHIADFTPRMYGNVRAVYQYVPIPKISYPQLEEELFCNIFYLRHLCDESKFPEWPIMNPIELLKDVLQLWKAEVEKKPSNMSYEDACSVLHLSPDKAPFNEGQIRKAYFRMAQKYHPDKNPEGRDIFETVNKAYEFLCSKKQKNLDGPDPCNILLVLKTQSILFKRYKEELAPYKYAGFPALIKTIQMETADAQLFSKTEPVLAEATELAFHVVNCSALNAQELRRESGIEILQESFSRCVALLSSTISIDEMPSRVCINAIKIFSVSAEFEECREKFMNSHSIIDGISQILHYKNLPQLCCVATDCVSAFAVDEALQTQLYKAGVVWSLTNFLFEYDFTLEESGIQKSGDTNQQELLNKLARLSITSLASLAGYVKPDSVNPLVHKTFCSLITPYLAKQVLLGKYSETLKLLNSNARNPYLLWNNETRIEIRDFLVKQQQKGKNEDFDPFVGIDFVFAAHRDELVVGDIFVNIYNEQPLFAIEEPKEFGMKLITFLRSLAEKLFSRLALLKHQKNGIDTKPDEQNSSSIQEKTLQNCHDSLLALSNIIRNNPGIEVICIGHFKMLTSFLRLEDTPKIHSQVLDVMLQVTSNQLCVENIADSQVVIPLLLALQSSQEASMTTLHIFYAMTSNTKIVKQIFEKGGTLYVLNLFCNESESELRVQAAELFAKMSSDKLYGPKVCRVLYKFLPSIFMDAMKDSPEASVHMFDRNHENPELIWNESSREIVKKGLNDFALELSTKHRMGKDEPWSLPPDLEPLFSSQDSTEIMVGGVFLRLFVAQPGWVLRNPKDFTVAIMDKFLALVSEERPNVENLETVTQSICCLFSSQPLLAEHIPVLGHLPSVFKKMLCQNDAIHKSCILVIHVLSSNESCVQTYGNFDCIKPLMYAMKSRPDMLGYACETLHRLFSVPASSQLMQQVVQCKLVQYLLELLDGVGIKGSENISSTKAQIVKTLKAMLNNVDFGEMIQGLLDNSRVWSIYKDQRHDLFISSSSVAGYLTAGPNVAGYLTAASDSSAPVAPDLS
uniref:DnaJ homolog subfamily C member 13 n=1 Tax=Phallusia mammillata TaxID=59560 RepID=A0A6F9DBR2_9ASCI|nr:dnaJ homolog subfamily C member 13 [Phallusia mammillata]